jgi:hypothetical protein
VSKLDLASRVPTQYDRSTFTDIIRAICNTVNPLAESRLSARYNAQASVPTTSSYAKGDFVPDSNCTVSASVVAGLGSSYMRLGWVCVASGTPGTFQEVRVLTGGGTGYPTFSPITNSLSGDVALNNTANYFDGPSVAQGTSGTWFASGTVGIQNAAASTFNVKLWDGTTVISSAFFALAGGAGTNQISCSLSGYLVNPAGNIRISVRDANNTTSSIKANASGNSKDSTVTAIRIG